MFDKLKLVWQVWGLVEKAKDMDGKTLKQAGAVFVGAVVAALVAAFVPDTQLSGGEIAAALTGAVTTVLGFLKQSPIGK